MNPSTLKTEMIPGKENESSAPSLRSVVLKSALLYVTIVLTSFPVLVYAGGPRAVIPTLKIMAGIGFLIWTVTFAVFSFASLARIYRTPVSSVKRSDFPLQVKDEGVADRWLDEPV